MVLPISNAGLQKAAILMVLLGEDTASHIYRNLPENDVQRLTRRIAELEHFKPETAISVLEEYYQLTLTQNYVAEGGPEYAQKLLVKAFGDVGAKRLLEQVSNAMEQNAVHLESLQEADPQQLAKFLEVEHPQTIALILAHLNARQASTLLLRLPEEIRAETVKRLAQLRQFSPEVAQKVALALNKRLESLGRTEPAHLCRIQRRCGHAEPARAAFQQRHPRSEVAQKVALALNKRLESLGRTEPAHLCRIQRRCGHAEPARAAFQQRHP